MNRLRWVVHSLLLLAFSVSANSQQPSDTPANPASGKAAAAKSQEVNQDSKEPYIIEVLQTKYSFEHDGKGYRETTLRINIKSESAVRDFGLLVYPYASSFESIEFLHVRVHKPDGSIVETPESEIQDLDSAVSREAPMYTDSREKHIAVRSLSVGDTLESNVRWKVHDPIAPGNFWLDHSYFKGGRCLKETLEINLPLDWKPSLRHFDPQPKIREEGSRRIYTFETSYSKPKEESKIPDWEKNYYGLEPPDVQFSSFANWGEVANWFSSLMTPKAVVTPEIQVKADELTKGKTTQDEKIRALYSFVSAHFRYIGIDLGIGRYSPHAAADVLTNRYGDCKDKHTLFAALLQASGIKAVPVLISSKYRIDPKMPTPSLFDHVISGVPHGDELQFLDTTPEVAPFGLLVRQLRDKEALLATKGGDLVKTPLKLSTPNYENFTVDGSIDAKGTFDAKMRLEEQGEDEITLRAVYRATPQNRWQDLTQALISRLGFGGTVSDVSVAQPEDTEKPFWIECSYHRVDYSEWSAGRITLPHPPFFMRELTEEQKLLKEPLPFGTPGNVKYISKVKFPSGFSPSVPEDVERKNSFAEFSVKYSLEKDTLTSTFQFKILTEQVPAADRTTFAKLTKLVENTENRYIFINGKLQNAMPLMALGIFPPGTAIPQMEAALERDPDNDNILQALSAAYLNAGRAKDAVAVLQKKIEEHPDVPPHLRLALGVAELRVPEPEKAMEEFKKVLTDTANLEEFNDAAYSLAEANVHLPEALEYSNHAVKEIAEETEEIAVEDAELDDFKKMLELAANWDTLGWIKFRMGDAQGAEKYLKAAWQLNQTAVIGEHLVEVYEKLGDKANAAAICNMAIAAVLPARSDEVKEKLSKEMARLKPFLRGTGSRGSTPDGAFALSDVRMFEVLYHTKLSANSVSAEFLVLLTNGAKVKAVRFLSGAAELKGADKALSAVEYRNSFPDDSQARIMRRGTLSCSIYMSKCSFILMPIADAASDVSKFPLIPN